MAGGFHDRMKRGQAGGSNLRQCTITLTQSIGSEPSIYNLFQGLHACTECLAPLCEARCDHGHRRNGILCRLLLFLLPFRPNQISNHEEGEGYEDSQDLGNLEAMASRITLGL